MRIIWFSRHAPLEAQRRELERLWPSHEISIDPSPFGDAADIMRRFERMGGDEVVIVCPLSVAAKLIELGLRPLWPDMEAVSENYALAHPEEAVPSPRGRWFRFVRFRRLVAIEMRFEDDLQK